MSQLVEEGAAEAEAAVHPMWHLAWMGVGVGVGVPRAVALGCGGGGGGGGGGGAARICVVAGLGGGGGGGAGLAFSDAGCRTAVSLPFSPAIFLPDSLPMGVSKPAKELGSTFSWQETDGEHLS